MKQLVAILHQTIQINSISISIMKTKEEQQRQQQQPFWHQTFPFKLYEMLAYSSDSEFSSSLSWSADGSTFIIHDKHVLMNDLAPMFFKQTKFRSFVSAAEYLDLFGPPVFTSKN